MTAAHTPKFSLVVATYGRTEQIGRLVASLCAQTFRDFEVVVADQNPDDRVVPLLAPLRDAGLLAAHLRLTRPSASGARNAGLAAARGEIVAFPDDDCWYACTTLERAAARFGADATLDGLAGRWVEASVMPGDERGEVTSDAMRRFRAGNLACITLFLRRDLVVRVGGFDERIGPGRWYAGAEETDLVLSFLAAGARMQRAPEVAVHHAPDDGPEAVYPLATIRARARGTGALYAKHRLPAWVVARGLVGPLASGSARPATRAAKLLGRVEGLVGWRLALRGAAAAATTIIRDKKEQTP
jgi:GT2 family glycosyltransferase